jgi:hypothetical protein
LFTDILEQQQTQSIIEFKFISKKALTLCGVSDEKDKLDYNKIKNLQSRAK